MKDLSKFAVVKQALEQIVAESDVNNGTQGAELLAHFWQQEYIYDETRDKLRNEIAKAVLQSRLDDVKKYQDEINKLPKPKIVMEFKLLTPIPRLQGTKVITDGEKTFKIHMENVSSIFVPEDAVKLGLLEYEETKDVARDAQGRETTVIKLRIKKGLIDVAAPIVDRFDKVLRPKRAYVTAISYGAMQTAGRLMNQEKQNKRRRTGFDEQQ
jgi:hypothetical protein